MSKCSKCGADADVRVGQVVSGDQLRWFRSMRCARCGAAVEEDGHGLDDEVRDVVLKQSGEWLLVVDDVALRVMGMVVVKACLGIESEGFAELKQFDESCIARGTKVEMRWVLERLAAKRIAASVLPRR